MSDEPVLATDIINTPQTLGVTPRYVLQHNAISRSGHNLSATAKKLTAMATALLPQDLSSLTAGFTFTEFCHAIGYTKSGELFKLFLEALKECMGTYISLELTFPETKKKTWENYTWFSMSRFDEKTGVATMTFSPQVASILLELKRVYTKISLQDLGASKANTPYGFMNLSSVTPASLEKTAMERIPDILSGVLRTCDTCWAYPQTSTAASPRRWACSAMIQPPA